MHISCRAQSAGISENVTQETIKGTAINNLLRANTEVIHAHQQAPWHPTPAMPQSELSPQPFSFSPLEEDQCTISLLEEERRTIRTSQRGRRSLDILAGIEAM